MENENQMVKAFIKAIADSGIQIELRRDFTTEKWEAKIDTSVHDKQIREDAIKEYKQSEEYIKECVQRYLKGKADKYQEITSAYMLLTEKQVAEIRADAIDDFQEWLKTQVVGIDNTTKEILVVVGDRWELAVEKYKGQKNEQ